MKRLVLDMGVPEENLRLSSAGWLDHIFTREYSSEVREDTLVFNFPNSWPNDVAVSEIDILKQAQFLVVAALGNTRTSRGRRDLWYPDHPWWSGTGWERSMRALATGKLLLAKHVVQSSDGSIIADEDNVKCGLAKEYCYSVMAPDKDLYTGTSGASSKLSALTFYLFQLWDTPREVVRTLNVCAEDVGEPGIDEEFGRGIVSVVCDRVQNRERSAVSESLSMHNASPVLTQMSGDYHSTSSIPQSLPSAGKFRPFYVLRGYNLETATGHLGGQISLKGADLFVSGGTSYTPLGMHSSFLPVARTPFMEFGTKRTLFSRGDHKVALLGTYGYSGRHGFSAHVSHLGTRYERHFSNAALAFQVGIQHLRGRVGIPGYQQANASPVSFMEHNPEMRVWFRFGW